MPKHPLITAIEQVDAGNFEEQLKLARDESGNDNAYKANILAQQFSIDLPDGSKFIGNTLHALLAMARCCEDKKQKYDKLVTMFKETLALLREKKELAMRDMLINHFKCSDENLTSAAMRAGPEFLEALLESNKNHGSEVLLNMRHEHTKENVLTTIAGDNGLKTQELLSLIFNSRVSSKFKEDIEKSESQNAFKPALFQKAVKAVIERDISLAQDVCDIHLNDIEPLTTAIETGNSAYINSVCTNLFNALNLYDRTLQYIERALPKSYGVLEVQQDPFDKKKYIKKDVLGNKSVDIKKVCDSYSKLFKGSTKSLISQALQTQNHDIFKTLLATELAIRASAGQDNEEIKSWIDDLAIEALRYNNSTAFNCLCQLYDILNGMESIKDGIMRLDALLLQDYLDGLLIGHIDAPAEELLTRRQEYIDRFKERYLQTDVRSLLRDKTYWERLFNDSALMEEIYGSSEDLLDELLAKKIADSDITQVEYLLKNGYDETALFIIEQMKQRLQQENIRLSIDGQTELLKLALQYQSSKVTKVIINEINRTDQKLSDKENVIDLLAKYSHGQDAETIGKIIEELNYGCDEEDHSILYSLMVKAIQCNNIALTSELVKKDSDCLYFKVEEGKQQHLYEIAGPEMLQHLLDLNKQYGKSPNKEVFYKLTLKQIIISQNPQYAKSAQICSQEAGEVITDSKGNNSLHYAVHSNNKKLAYELVKQNPDLKNLPNAIGVTPLDLAYKTDKHRLVRILQKPIADKQWEQEGQDEKLPIETARNTNDNLGDFVALYDLIQKDDSKELFEKIEEELKNGKLFDKRTEDQRNPWQFFASYATPAQFEKILELAEEIKSHNDKKVYKSCIYGGDNAADGDILYHAVKHENTSLVLHLLHRQKNKIPVSYNAICAALAQDNTDMTHAIMHRRPQEFLKTIQRVNTQIRNGAQKDLLPTLLVASSELLHDISSFMFQQYDAGGLSKEELIGFFSTGDINNNIFTHILQNIGNKYTVADLEFIYSKWRQLSTLSKEIKLSLPELNNQILTNILSNSEVRQFCRDSGLLGQLVYIDKDKKKQIIRELAASASYQILLQLFDLEDFQDSIQTMCHASDMDNIMLYLLQNEHLSYSEFADLYTQVSTGQEDGLNFTIDDTRENIFHLAADVNTAQDKLRFLLNEKKLIPLLRDEDSNRNTALYTIFSKHPVLDIPATRNYINQYVEGTEDRRTAVLFVFQEAIKANSLKVINYLCNAGEVSTTDLDKDNKLLIQLAAEHSASTDALGIITDEMLTRIARNEDAIDTDTLVQDIESQATPALHLVIKNAGYYTTQNKESYYELLTALGANTDVLASIDRDHNTPLHIVLQERVFNQDLFDHLLGMFTAGQEKQTLLSRKNLSGHTAQDLALQHHISNPEVIKGVFEQYPEDILFTSDRQMREINGISALQFILRNNATHILDELGESIISEYRKKITSKESEQDTKIAYWLAESGLLNADMVAKFQINSKSLKATRTEDQNIIYYIRQCLDQNKRKEMLDYIASPEVDYFKNKNAKLQAKKELDLIGLELQQLSDDIHFTQYTELLDYLASLEPSSTTTRKEPQEQISSSVKIYDKFRITQNSKLSVRESSFKKQYDQLLDDIKEGNIDHIIKILEQYPNMLQLRDRGGYTALQRMFGFLGENREEGLKNDRVRLMCEVIARFANHTITDDNGNTPLHSLLDYFSSIFDRQTPLSPESNYEAAIIIQDYINQAAQYGARLDVRNKTGNIPLDIIKNNDVLSELAKQAIEKAQIEQYSQTAQLQQTLERNDISQLSKYKSNPLFLGKVWDIITKAVIHSTTQDNKHEIKNIYTLLKERGLNNALYGTLGICFMLDEHGDTLIDKLLTKAEQAPAELRSKAMLSIDNILNILLKDSSQNKLDQETTSKMLLTLDKRGVSNLSKLLRSSGARQFFTTLQDTIGKLCVDGLLDLISLANDCVIGGNTDLLPLLEDITNRKINFNLADNSGQTAIFHAITNGNVAVLEDLLTQGARINVSRANDGATPLHHALTLMEQRDSSVDKQEDYLKIIGLLVSRGADLLAQDNNEVSVLDLANKIVDSANDAKSHHQELKEKRIRETLTKKEEKELSYLDKRLQQIKNNTMLFEHLFGKKKEFYTNVQKLNQELFPANSQSKFFKHHTNELTDFKVDLEGKTLYVKVCSKDNKQSTITTADLFSGQQVKGLGISEVNLEVNNNKVTIQRDSTGTYRNYLLKEKEQSITLDVTDIHGQKVAEVQLKTDKAGNVTTVLTEKYKKQYFDKKTGGLNTEFTKKLDPKTIGCYIFGYSLQEAIQKGTLGNICNVRREIIGQSIGARQASNSNENIIKQHKRELSSLKRDVKLDKNSDRTLPNDTPSNTKRTRSASCSI